MKDAFQAAVGIDAQGDITGTHFGDSDSIAFVEISVEGFKILQEMENPLRQIDEEGHGSREKLEAAQGMLRSATFVIAGKMSPNFKKMRLNKGKMPIVTSRDLHETLTYLVKNLDAIAAYFEDRKNIYFKIQQGIPAVLRGNTGNINTCL